MGFVCEKGFDLKREREYLYVQRIENAKKRYKEREREGFVWKNLEVIARGESLHATSYL